MNEKIKPLKYEVVDLSNYIPSEYTYKLEWFELMGFYEDRVVIFGVGHWSYHIMDWLGCNFWHGRLPKSPIFDSVEDARDWLIFQVKMGVYYDGMELRGHHSGDPHCRQCNRDETKPKRELDITIFFSEIKKEKK